MRENILFLYSDGTKAKTPKGKEKKMKSLIGNTYPHKEVIKQKGGKWNANSCSWMVPDDVYEELEKLCSQQNNSKTKLKNFSHYFECDDCGDRVCAGTQCWETGLTH